MATSALRWFQAALLLQIGLLAYWLAIEVVAMPPWNDLAARPADYGLTEKVALNALPRLALMALFVLGIRVLAVVAVAGYAVDLAIQLWHWWKPYLFGADANWYGTYETLYTNTTAVLPAEGLHLPPDAQHLVLQLLTLATLGATAMAVSRMRHL